MTLLDRLLRRCPACHRSGTLERSTSPQLRGWLCRVEDCRHFQIRTHDGGWVTAAA